MSFSFEIYIIGWYYLKPQCTLCFFPRIILSVKWCECNQVHLVDIFQVIWVIIIALVLFLLISVNVGNFHKNYSAELDNQLRFVAGSNLTPRALRLQLQLWAKIIKPKSSSSSSANKIGAEKLQLQFWKKKNWANKIQVQFRSSIKLVHLFKIKGKVRILKTLF